MTGLAYGDGLDLSNQDSVDAEEIERFRDYYGRVKGGLLPAHDLLLEFRPDLLKRHRLFARVVGDPGNERFPLNHTLMHLHYYAVTGFGYGVLYEARQARSAGADRADVLDTLGIAYLHAGPRGFAAVAESARDYLREWTEPGGAGKWPEHWSYDPRLVATGVDFGQPEVLDGEVERIVGWYEQTIGMVPGHVALLAEHRPLVLKAFRNRFEHAIRDGLPHQMIPYCLLHLAICRGSAAGIREQVLLGRAFGLTTGELLDVVGWGLLYGGPDSLTLVREAAGDLLELVS